MSSNKNGKNYVPYASRTEISLAVLFGCLAILLYVLLSALTDIPVSLLATGVILLYLLSILAIAFFHASNVRVSSSYGIYSLLSEEGAVVLKNTASPVLVIDAFGKILWYNEAARAVFPDRENYIDRAISELFGEAVVPEFFTGKETELFGRRYRMESYRISSGKEELYAIRLDDCTDLYDLSVRYEDEKTAVAYVAIDNAEDILQYVHDQFQDAVGAVDAKLRAWADSMHAVLRTYDNDKYLLIFDAAHLRENVANRFSILDEIRDTRVGDGISVTVSMGVSCIPGSLFDRERAASEAIDLALQRGGDQVVLKSEDSVDYYGGRTKSVYKRSNVHSRTFANRLMSLMARSDNVMIMGHRYGDFDSFGAAVGVARLALLCGVKANIAVDLRDKNLLPCIRMMQEQERYSATFIDNAEGLDLLSPDTLLVLVDHNTLTRSQFSDIAEKVSHIVVIDHHRKIGDFSEKVIDSYIEPSASSTCELVAEMLECTLTSQALLKEEADILLAGILLDTKRFSRNTGTRTFGAAQYLRGTGASPADVFNLFKTDPSELTKEAHFHTAITVYRDIIAISCYDGDTDESYRVIASKAADEMLTLKKIEAAFTLVRIGDQIHISGRSTGKINVQLILEKLHGGGHFDVAGAQVVSDSGTAVLEMLKDSIDSYLDNNF